MGIKQEYSAETFGERVRRLREAKGFSQGELGARVGYKGNLPIYNIERGETQAPRGAKLGLLAKALDTTVEYLLEGRVTESRVEYEIAYPSLQAFLEKHADVTPQERAFLASQRFSTGDQDLGNDSWWSRQLKEFRGLLVRATSHAATLGMERATVGRSGETGERRRGAPEDLTEEHPDIEAGKRLKRAKK